MPDDVDIDYEYEKARAAARRGATATLDPADAHSRDVHATLDAQDREMEAQYGPSQPELESLTYDEARAKYGVAKSPKSRPP